MNILVEIPTKDRDRVLGRCFAALLNQSFQEFDVLVLNDGDQKVGGDSETAFYLKELMRDRLVTVRPGSRISQAHNHNIALYEYPEYDTILRLDDDVLLNRLAMEGMVSALLLFKQHGCAAIGGLWFESEWIDEKWHDRGSITWNPITDPGTDGKVGPINNNMQQRMYHAYSDGHGLQRVEHIYGPCLYDAEAMRRVGGWPEVYSKGVAHGEETDGTYRLHLAGYRLYIDASVTGQHLKSGGGIRAHGNVGLAQALDNAKWQNRLPLLKEINFEPTVAVWSQHAFGIGGAQRVFYETVSLLQSKSGLGHVDPIFTGDYMTPEQCEEAFGFPYEDTGQRVEEYDVCLVFAHEPLYPVRAKHYILYTFFPDEPNAEFVGIDRILAISDYTREHIGMSWGYKAKTLYLPARFVKLEEHTGESHRQEDGFWVSEGWWIEMPKKKKQILIVCRCDPYKAPLWLMERFIEFGLEGFELHYVMATTGGIYHEYEEQVREYASGHDNIVIHENITQAELDELYMSSMVLWSANGMYADKKPKVAEHFGLTPIEAYSALCIPVVFDCGGHRETVHEAYRWSNVEELRIITDGVISGEVEHEVVQLEKYSWDRYLREIEWEIRRVNAMAVELDRTERIEVRPKKIRVAAIADSPRLTSGFGIVANEIYKRILAQDDMELFVMGLYDPALPRPDEKLPYGFFPAHPDDLQAQKTLPRFIQWAEPDVIWELYDPGSIWGHKMGLNALGLKQPWVVYFPVEGWPPTKECYQLVRMVEYPVTYCRSGMEAIQALHPDLESLDYVYHGIDHAPFAPMDPDRRKKLRELVGWDDKFVVMNIGTNKRVKQQPYMIDAMRILLEGGYDDVYMYLHTKRFDLNVLSGWDLEWIINVLGVTFDLPISEHILFPAPTANKMRGVPFRFEENIDPFKMTVPPDPKMRGALFHSLDFISRMCLADMYMDVSSAEGFGLPPLEAAACGVPTIVVDDQMVRTEVHSKYCGLIEPRHWTTWHVGSRLQLVDPAEVARCIVEVKENEEWRMSLSERGMRVMDDLKWEAAGQLFVDKIRAAYTNARQS